MSLDITPLIPAGRQFIQRYRGGIFRISDVDYDGAVIVFPEQTVIWPVSSEQTLELADFTPVIDADPVIEILLFGGGDAMRLLPARVRNGIRAAGAVVEPMDTGAACRTFNVLMSEDRRVAAALLPLA